MKKTNGQLDLTPASLGFRMPAEWSRHSATWMAWPTNEETWPTGLEIVQERYLEMIEVLVEGEKVYLLVDSETDFDLVREKLERRDISPSAVELLIIPTVDAWIRDYGPNFLVRPAKQGMELAFNDWGFNAWGGKYPGFSADGRIPRAIPVRTDLLRFEPEMVLEGGSIEVNGDGLCLTTRQCLLNPNRNPGLSAEQIDGNLKAFLGVRKTIWLNRGIEGDDTDGHIDDIARFTGPSTVVVTVEEDRNNPNYLPLEENHQILVEIAEREQLFQVVTLPTPEPILSAEDPLPASYANFYIGNTIVLVPTFNQSSDQRVLGILASLFPDRRIKGIDASEIIKGMGALHCLTLQQPYSDGLEILDAVKP